MKQELLNSETIPGTSKTYRDLEILLASIYKTFHRHTFSHHSEIRENFYMMNGYLNTLAVRYKIHKPFEIAANDEQFYMTAVPVYVTEQEVMCAIDSFLFDFKIEDTQCMVPISNHAEYLMKLGFIEISTN